MGPEQPLRSRGDCKLLPPLGWMAGRTHIHRSCLCPTAHVQSARPQHGRTVLRPPTPATNVPLVGARAVHCFRRCGKAIRLTNRSTRPFASGSGRVSFHDGPCGRVYKQTKEKMKRTLIIPAYKELGAARVGWTSFHPRQPRKGFRT